MSNFWGAVQLLPLSFSPKHTFSIFLNAPFRFVDYTFPVDAHRAESRFQRPRQNLHQTAFSASVAPEHCRHAACFDEQVNTRENAPFAERQLCGVDFENMFFSGWYAAGRRNSSAKDSITRNPPRSLRPAVFGGGCRGCGNSRIHRNSAG